MRETRRKVRGDRGTCKEGSRGREGEGGKEGRGREGGRGREREREREEGGREVGRM